MDLFTKLFGSWLTLVYHCFDRIVISGYLMGLLKAGQVAHWLRASENVPGVTKEILARRTTQYVNWVESYARNHRIPIEWAEKGVRKEDYVLPYLRRAAARGPIRSLFHLPSYGTRMDVQAKQEAPSKHYRRANGARSGAVPASHPLQILLLLSARRSALVR